MDSGGLWHELSASPNFAGGLCWALEPGQKMLWPSSSTWGIPEAVHRGQRAHLATHEEVGGDRGGRNPERFAWIIFGDPVSLGLDVNDSFSERGREN